VARDLWELYYYIPKCSLSISRTSAS